MNQIDMSQFSNQELRDDLAETIGDIKVCELALLHDIQTYSDNQSTRRRLKVNQNIKRLIETELERRNDF